MGQGIMTYIEIEQNDLTDSEMLDVIREKMLDGWALSDYKYDLGVKVWVFEKEEKAVSGIAKYEGSYNQWIGT